MKFSFYRADALYCDYLRKSDPCVPYTMDQKEARPFIGIVLTLNDYDYYAPLTSPKPKHLHMKNQVDFLKINGGVWGAINFNNMIPIHSDQLEHIDIRILPTDDKAILRQVRYPANADIDSSRTHLNYSLSPDRDMAPADYLQKRLSQLHCMEREDVRTMCGWVITKPKDLPESEERRFFRLCYDFLAQRYGERNVVAAEVHKDESGEAHLHFYFVPVAQYTPSQHMVNVVRYFEEHPHEANISKVARELGTSRKTVLRYRNKTASDIPDGKVCAYEVLNRKELLSFHGDLKLWLLQNGLDANVNSGITVEQGGNRTVAELKQEREQQREQQHTTTHEHEF